MVPARRPGRRPPCRRSGCGAVRPARRHPPRSCRRSPTAPALADAQLSANRSVMVTFLPSRIVSRKRTWPYPGAVATNSYVPGANACATLSRFGPRRVAASVSAIGEAAGLVVPDEDPRVDRNVLVQPPRHEASPSRESSRSARSPASDRCRCCAVVFVLVALRPIPCRANSSHSSFWFAPPNRIRSAASWASRAWSMDGFVGMSSIASNRSCTQRRLPGQFWGRQLAVRARDLEVGVVRRELAVVLRAQSAS